MFVLRGSGAGGTGRRAPVFRKCIHKIIEILVDLNLDSCYKVIRNRVFLRSSFSISCFGERLKKRPVCVLRYKDELKNLGVLVSTARHSIERHGSHICKSSR